MDLTEHTSNLSPQVVGAEEWVVAPQPQLHTVNVRPAWGIWDPESAKANQKLSQTKQTEAISLGNCSPVSTYILCTLDKKYTSVFI